MILKRLRIPLILLSLLGLVGGIYAVREFWLETGPIAIAPHQALYSMTISRLHQANTISDVRGQMSYRIEDACDGWNVAQRFNLQFVYTTAPSSIVTSDYNTFESKDGRRYQFSTRRTRDGEVTDEVLGKAERRDVAGNGVINYQKPKVAEAVVPAAVLFPTQHTLKLLQEAAAGNKWINSPLFDGSDLSLATDVSGFIRRVNKPYIVKVEDMVPIVPSHAEDGEDSADVEIAAPTGPRPMTPDQLNASALISGTRAWRIRLAFYPKGDAIVLDEKKAAEADDPEKSLVPDYEMTMTLHSNGVVSAFTLDYPDFSLDAHLLSIIEVAKNSC